MALKVGKASRFHKFTTSRWTECSMWQEAKRAWLGQTRSRTRMMMRSTWRLKMMLMTTMAILRTTWVQMPGDLRYNGEGVTIKRWWCQQYPFASNHQSSGAQLGRCLWDVDRGRPATASQKVKDLQKNSAQKKKWKESFGQRKLISFKDVGVRKQ